MRIHADADAFTLMRIHADTCAFTLMHLQALEMMMVWVDRKVDHVWRGHFTYDLSRHKASRCGNPPPNPGFWLRGLLENPAQCSRAE